MTRKVNNIIDRVIKRKAVGIIYNIPKTDEAILQNKLLDQKKAVVIRGRDAYTAPMFMFRLSSKLKIKNITFNQVAAFIEGKLITVTGADVIKSSYNRIIDDAYKYKVPLLILMNSDTTMKDFRKLKAYTKILTIEQDYNYL